VELRRTTYDVDAAIQALHVVDPNREMREGGSAIRTTHARSPSGSKHHWDGKARKSLGLLRWRPLFVRGKRLLSSFPFRRVSG
jgi:hypothetical protein